ncbi:glycosyltransferase [Algoriphagus halophytocola]|uniref:glycosyltransferase n=1 Tax=Algoriphagus halophytocola TaxID=2991499 RepID=UPI0022DDB0DD|nr:glycosyltransferase [Algoriphagus sp. TR-M9]WBL41305.1 glycosyltransferase [Algoriphagus sp. TR-M9]
MQKILIIPSWYPALKKPLNGSFFREQAELLNFSKVGEIAVLYGEEQSISFLKLIWIYFLSLVKTNWPISKGLVIQSPDAYGFIIPKNRRVPEKYRVKLAIRLFQKAFLSLKVTGFVPDLIHAQSGMDAGIYAHELSKEHTIPFVIIEHQVFVFHYYSRYRAKLILEAFALAKKTAAVSYDERRQVMMNQPACNPEVIWNLVDEDMYSINLARRNKTFTVITILNSLPIKGAVEFLEAMAIVIRRDSSIRFIMVGKGADENSIHSAENLFVRKSRELGIYDHGEFLPLVPRERISDVLSQAHVFVSPSIQEPHGIAVREAMMCGLPLVSTSNGGVEDSINAQTGLLVPVRDAEAMADAILQLKFNYTEYNPNAIRELAIEQCGKKAFTKKMINFYRFS